MFVSIIIPARNEEKTISLTLKSVLAQKYRKKEIIVMDNASEDRTPEIVKEFQKKRKAKVRLIRNEKNIGIGNSLNRGIKAARGKIVIILHSDHYTDDNKWIEKMIEPFKDPLVGAVVSQRVNKNRRKMSLAEKLFDSLSPHSIKNITGRPKEIPIFRIKADAYRKDVLEKLGYFDGDYYPYGGEDNDMSIKMKNAGYKIVLSDKAMVENVFSSHQRGMKSVFRKAYEYGFTASRLYARHRFDGLRTRLFALIFLSIAAYPLTNGNILFYSLLLLLGIFSFVTLPLIKLKIPLSAISVLFLIAFPFVSAVSQKTVAFSVILTHLLVLLQFGLHSVINSLKEGDSVLISPFIFIFSIAWRFVSAFGYMAGFLQPAQKKP